MSTGSGRTPGLTAPIRDDLLVANAFAVTFRLIGEPMLARRTALMSVKGAVDTATTQGIHPLIVVTEEALRRTVDHLRPEPDDPYREERLELAHRISRCDRFERVCGALIHLAGHDPATVSAVVGRPVEEVEDAATALAAPEGGDWNHLGERPLVTPDGVVDLRGPRRTPSAEPPDMTPVESGRQGPAWIHRLRTLIPSDRRGAGRSAAVVLAALAAITLPTQCTGDRPGFARESSAATSVNGSEGCSAPESTLLAPGTGETTPDGPSARPYRVAVPVTPPGDPRPAVIALPDADQSPEALAASLGLDEAGRAGRWVVAIASPASFSVWNARRDPLGADDAAALQGILEDLGRRTCVDLDRVHLVGVGLGGQMAGTTSCALPGRFASVSMISGSHLPESCTPDRSTSVLLAHALDDDVIAYEGGYGPAARALPPGPEGLRRVEPAPFEDSVAAWTEGVGCNPAAGGAPADDRASVTTHGAGCPDGVVVVTARFPRGGHDLGGDLNEVVSDFIAGRSRGA